MSSIIIMIHFIIVMSMIALASCSNNLTTDDYNAEEMRSIIAGEWVSHPSEYECSRYHLSPNSEVFLEIKDDNVIVIRNLPVVYFERAKEAITIVDDSGSWRLKESIAGSRWELRLRPNNVRIDFGIEIKKKFNTIYLDYIIDPEYPSGFIFNKVKSNP